MSKTIDFNILFDGFRDKETIFALKRKITEEAKALSEKLFIMEVCGGPGWIVVLSRSMLWLRLRKRCHPPDLPTAAWLLPV